MLKASYSKIYWALESFHTNQMIFTSVQASSLNDSPGLSPAASKNAYLVSNHFRLEIQPSAFLWEHRHSNLLARDLSIVIYYYEELPLLLDKS